MIDEEVLLAALHSANEIGLAAKGVFGRYIKYVIENADIVIAVWQDETAPFGVGSRIIKGQERLLQCTAAAIKATIAGIPCDCAEQAEALFQV